MKKFSYVALGLAVLALIFLLLAMTGARFGFWEPSYGFGLYRSYLNPIGFTLLALGLVGLILHVVKKQSRGLIAACLTTFVGIGLLAPLINESVNKPPRAAPIHDISTDLESPPKFLVLDDTREGAKNSLVYAGEEVASVQAKAYPDIGPLLSTLEPQLAFQRALSVAKNSGWTVVAMDEKLLRFEASARSPYFSFIDDVVVTVKADASQSRIDIRSVSRVGRSDRGTNAARILKFQSDFSASK